MRQRGFTLIEVLIALAVLGIAMAAAVRATIAVSDGSQMLHRHLAGGWVAQNRLNNYIARRQFPDPGVSEGTERQAGLEFAWRETVGETMNKSFRRVEVRVYEPNHPEHADIVLIGYIANAPN
ncbi:type II secretion system minor pseudopilin GspI [Chitinimonas sp. BJB300]|uniref:type II secretion system minor pseudopilin GspI n=1 Tax=Chitinimonas sp. BJB300 TaxID=1559339 RepID=UPI000C0F41EE|nr:type II secretion system minor pseudopilin GspI [Chitinimonas sp. BJB300]PHV11716.1 type II secretion system protein GspI [Chitinimonas sp. BJB300]TSJ89993.1 type II secretion system protein GspI [Chitinimonas sp. BJB300]